MGEASKMRCKYCGGVLDNTLDGGYWCNYCERKLTEWDTEEYEFPEEEGEEMDD